MLMLQSCSFSCFMSKRTLWGIQRQLPLPTCSSWYILILQRAVWNTIRLSTAECIATCLFLSFWVKPFFFFFFFLRFSLMVHLQTGVGSMRCAHCQHRPICSSSALGKFSKNNSVLSVSTSFKHIPKLWITVLKNLTNFQIHLPFKNPFFLILTCITFPSSRIFEVIKNHPVWLFISLTHSNAILTSLLKVRFFSSFLFLIAY